MGIYPTETVERMPDGKHLRIVHEEPGLTVTRTYVIESTVEVRTDCFCCSCGEREGSDVACRNHGYYGRRPCEVHDMPGTPWMNEDGSLSGDMPESVQAHRARESR